MGQWWTGAVGRWTDGLGKHRCSCGEDRSWKADAVVPVDRARGLLAFDWCIDGAETAHGWTGAAEFGGGLELVQ